MRSEFEVHILNDEGKFKARKIAEAFDELTAKLEAIWGPNSLTRNVSLTRTKLEEACFFAKKEMASQEINQGGLQ